MKVIIVNSSLGKKIGVLESTCINYIVGLICSTLVLVVLGSSENYKFIIIATLFSITLFEFLIRIGESRLGHNNDIE